MEKHERIIKLVKQLEKENKPLLRELEEKAQEYLDSLKIPKWGICIEESTGDWAGVLNRLYKIEKENDFTTWNLKGYTGSHSKSRFRIATKAEIEAHKLGFHIGDKVWLKDNNIEKGVILNFFDGGYTENIVVITDKTNSSGLWLDDITNKEPVPKLITEEGDKLYGNDRCWYISKIENFNDSLFYNWDGNEIHNGKYFSKKENAEQYFTELQIKKRGIDVGTKIFAKKNKDYLGKISAIKFGNLSLWIGCDMYTLNYIITLEELIKEEGLKIGIELDKELLHAWLNSYIKTNPAKIKDSILLKFVIIGSIPYFSTNLNTLRLIGFKKFKEKWELKQNIKDGWKAVGPGIREQLDSDLDIDKTCETCKHFKQESHTADEDYYVCDECSKNKESQWQPKKSKFEVDTWYEHEAGSFGLFTEEGSNNKGLDLLETGSYEWITNMQMTDPTEWSLADIDKIEELLLKKANKDYPKDTEFINAFNLSSRAIARGKFTYYPKDNQIVDYSSSTVYFKGKWAKIMKEPILMLGNEEVLIILKIIK